MDSIGLFTGGCATNTGIASARMGLRVGVVSAVGRDAFGSFLLRRLKDEGIDVRGTRRVPERMTSATAVLVSADGERSFLHHQGASASIREVFAPVSLLREYRAIHIGGFFMMPGFDGAPVRRLLAKAKRLGLMTSLDTCWDPKRRWHLVRSCLPEVDYYMPSLEEAAAVFGVAAPARIADAAFRAGVRRAVILKLGARGCFARERGGKTTVIPAFRVRQVDATGAGDAFDAGFLAGILRGHGLVKSLGMGCAAGALCVSGPGALGRIERLSQIRRMLSKK